VARVQAALDEACAGTAQEISGDFVDAIPAHDLADRAADFCDALRLRHHAVVKVDGFRASDLLAAAGAVLGDAEARAALGPAEAVHVHRPREYTGIFASGRSTFAEFRFDARDRALQPTLSGGKKGAALRRELEAARLTLGGVGVLALETVDPSGAFGLWKLVDDVTCVNWVATGEVDAASSTAQRLCLYEAGSSTAVGSTAVFGPHTDTTFLTVVPFSSTPGLQVWDPSRKAWVCPEAAGGDDCVLLLPGELLELSTLGEYKAAVHRVVSTPDRRVSAPLLVRGARRAHAYGVVPMSVAWEALQKSTPDAASQIVSDAFTAPQPASAADETALHVVPKRTVDEWRAFAALRRQNVRLVWQDPVVMAIDDFATAQECDAVLRLVVNETLKASEVLARAQEQKHVVAPSHRTSTTAWLQDAAFPDQLSRRAASFAGLPLSHAEKWQCAKYAATQQYAVHTDNMDSFNALAPGGRVASVLLYLDDGFQGGETAFPLLNFTYTPRKGSALFFQNVRTPVLDPYALETDQLSAHAGRPVVSGHKHIATKWFHPVPFPDGQPAD